MRYERPDTLETYERTSYAAPLVSVELVIYESRQYRCFADRNIAHDDLRIKRGATA